MTKFLNISTDNTLGGSSPSDETVSSQKAIKAYVDGLKTDWYGTCSTGASTQAKVVSCTGFVLTTGVSIRVKFTNNQSYNGNPTLNVNGTGALSVKAYGTTNAARYYWRAGEVVAFTYDGTNWIMEDGATATTSYFGVTALTTSATSTSDTRAATPASINSLVQNMIEPYPVYSASSTYAVGDKVRYSFNAWVCNTAITGEGEAWNANHWTKIDDIQTQLDGKQANLVSGTNIKTINNTSLLGSGNITVDSLPSQTGQSGKFLTTNGTSASWGSALTSNDVTSIYTATGTDPVNGVAVSNAIAPKQDTLVSGTNIKTINGNSVLGSGNIVIETSSTPSVDGTTISYNSNDSLQTIGVINKNGGTTLPIWQGTELQWNQGISKTWYYWQTAITANWTTTTIPASGLFSAFNTIAFGNGKLVALGGVYIIATSIDNGETWEAQTTSVPVASSISSITYGNNMFLCAGGSDMYPSDATAYSTDGINWSSASTLPSASLWKVVFYNGVFIAFKSDQIVYSSDPSTGAWQTATIPENTTGIVDCSYGNGVFVAICNGKSIYSTDNGITWSNGGTLQSNYSYIDYGNGRFVALSKARLSAYSLDGGISWVQGISINFNPIDICFGENKFVAILDSNNSSAYSLDGETWVSIYGPSIGSSSSVGELIYNNGRFIAVFQNFESTNSAYLEMSSLSCFTETDTPTESSYVYSEPNVLSQYSITSVSSGAITLSDNNTYYYNQSGNQYTYQSIGAAHPDWLCFINGVGVKIGTTTIATA